MAKVPETPKVGKPRISVLERRLQNPFGEPSAPIDLKDPSLVCRWFNGSIIADKIWRAKHKGWTPVRPEDVSDLDQIGGYTKSVEGFVTRGERGQEVLMSMPREDRDAIQMAKTRVNLANMGNPNRQKDEIANAAAAQLGSEAADYVHQHLGPVGGVRDSIERVERMPIE